MKNITVNPMHPWAKTSRLSKSLNGFFSYQLAAFLALIAPEEVDKAMYVTLGKQFIDEHEDTIHE